MRVDRWFAFVDLSGFTSFGDQFGDDESVRVLTAFRAAVRQVATDFGVRIAKWLGDGCMLVSVDPSQLIGSVAKLEECTHELELPLSMHAGCAGGDVILLEGDDYTGRSVNLAARLDERGTRPRDPRDGRARTARARRHADRTGRHDLRRGHPRPGRGRAFRLCGGRRYRSGMTDYTTVEFTRDGHVGWLRLNRPDKLNSFTIVMWQELRALGKELRDDPDLRALVVIGNGRAFSSGIDTSVFTGGSTDSIEGGDDIGTRHRDPTVDGILRTQEAYSWLEEARYPTIAAVRGFALGAGLQMALACDIRVFARGTSVGLLEHKYGILPDLGGTQRLPRVVGAGKAKEMIWTAARIDADEAYRIGLCERLVDDDALERDATALAGDDRRATAARGAGREAGGRSVRAGAGRGRARRRGRGAGRVPAVGRHARGDPGVRGATPTRLLG